MLWGSNGFRATVQSVTVSTVKPCVQISHVPPSTVNLCPKFLGSAVQCVWVREDLLLHQFFECCKFLLMIKEMGSSTSYDLQFYNIFFPSEIWVWEKKWWNFLPIWKKKCKCETLKIWHIVSDEETTVEIRTLPKPDPSVIVQVEAKRGNSRISSLVKGKNKSYRKVVKPKRGMQIWAKFYWNWI